MQNLSRHTNRGVLHGILDDIGDGVVLTDAQERVLYINDASISILGCTDIRDEPVLFSDICPLVDLDTDVPIGSPIKRAIQLNAGRIPLLQAAKRLSSGRNARHRLSKTIAFHNKIWYNLVVKGGEHDA